MFPRETCNNKIGTEKKFFIILDFDLEIFLKMAQKEGSASASAERQKAFLICLR
jgi:hypothetical protein